MVENVVDCDEHFSGYGYEGYLVSAAFGDSMIEVTESRVMPGRVLGGFDEDPAYVAVAFFGDVAVDRYCAGLMCARGEACVTDKLLG
jgi:hypothetical protein